MIDSKSKPSTSQIFSGGGLCCLSSFPKMWDVDGAPKGDARFYIALVGQAITGVANAFIISIPTKVRNILSEIQCE